MHWDFAHVPDLCSRQLQIAKPQSSLPACLWVLANLTTKLFLSRVASNINPGLKKNEANHFIVTSQLEFTESNVEIVIQ